MSPDGESCVVFAGEEIGPLCPSCNERMTECGLLEDEA